MEVWAASEVGGGVQGRGWEGWDFVVVGEGRVGEVGRVEDVSVLLLSFIGDGLFRFFFLLGCSVAGLANGKDCGLTTWPILFGEDARTYSA